MPIGGLQAVGGRNRPTATSRLLKVVARFSWSIWIPYRGDGSGRRSSLSPGNRFSEEQIIGILREQEVGSTTAEICRRHGINEQTFYHWKAKYSGMTASDAQRLKALDDENRRLKKLLAEAILAISALKDLLGKTDIACGTQGGRPAPDDEARLLAATCLGASR